MKVSSFDDRKLKGKRYVVTGGTGFLGSHLIPLLLKAGSSVRLYSRSAVDARALFGEGAECVVGHLSDVAALTEAMKGCHGCFHLAGQVVHSRTQGAAELWECNVEGTLAVVKAAHKSGLNRVVYASTSGVVGCSTNAAFVATDESPYCSEVVRYWPYYVSKVEAERLALKYCQNTNVELICLRPTMMWGPGDDRYRSTKLILSYLTRHIPFIPPGGVSWVDVRDAAIAFKRAMISGSPAGSTYLLGARNCTTMQLFETLEKLSGVPRPSFAVPAWFAKSGATVLDFVNRRIRNKYDPSVDPVRAEMGCHFWYISSKAAEKDLGFTPRDSSVTLIDTINFIRKNEKILSKL